MTRHDFPRRRLDHTVLAALNIIVLAGGITAIYHWVSFAQSAPPTMLCAGADAAVPTTTVNCVGGAEMARSSAPHVG